MKISAAFYFFFFVLFLNTAFTQSSKMLVRTLTGVKIMDLTGPVPIIGPQIAGFGGGSVEEEVNIMTDASNNILFLTAADAGNNISVLTSSFTPMPNGVIQGDNSALESAICKIPCTTDKYYFFNYLLDLSTNDGSINYSIIDMSLNGGLGDITQKNIYLGSGFREGLTISHQMRNGCRWLLAPGYDSSNNFYIKEFKISNSGITGPVILDVFPMASPIITPHEIELSSDNLKLCVSTFSVNPSDPDIILYDFDLETGTLSARQALSVTPSNVLGIEFSPDGSKIYYQTNTTNTSTLGRYDITTASNQIIDNTRTSYQSDPELGGNGRIYIGGNYVESYISEIADPNNPNVANIQYTRNAYLVSPGGCRPGLSNCIDGEPPGTSNVPTQIDFTYLALAGCNNFQFLDSSCLGTWQQWDFGDGQISSDENPIHQYMNSGNYNVTLRVLTCSDTLNVTHSLIINQALPILNISPDISICSGDSTLLYCTGAATYNWSPNLGLSSASDSIIYAHPSTTTTYTVSGAFATGCSLTRSVTVNINSADVTINTSGSTNVCSGTTVILNGNGTSQYVWSNGDTSSSISVTSSGVYYLNGFENGCQDLDSITIIFNPIPALTLSGPNSIINCNGSSSTIQVTGADSYFWSPSLGISSTTDSIINASPLISTIYTVTGTNQFGCTSTTTVTVTPSIANVSISVLGDTILCYGESVDLTANGTTLYLWSTGSTNTTINISSSGQYILEGIENGCSDFDTINVQVNPLPNLTLNVPPVIQTCNNSTVTLQAYGATNYSWTPTQGLNTSTGSQVIANPISETIYTVTGTNSDGCYITTTIDIQPHFINAIINSTGQTNFCAGDSVILNANGGQNYQWSNFETTESIIALTSGNYSVIVSDSFCLDSSTISLNFNPLPIISISTYPNTEFCSGDSIIMVLNSLPNVTNQWYFNSNLIQNQISDSLILHSGGIYSIISQDNNGCRASEIIPISEIPNPIANFTAPTTTCSSLVNFNNQSINYLNSRWEIDNLYQTNSQNFSFTFPDTGRYIVTLIAQNQMCFDTISNVVNIGKKPLSGFSSNFVCGLEQSFVNYSINSTTSQWFFGDGTRSSVTNPIHTFPTQGFYVVTLSSSDNNGCLDTISNLINIIDDIPADFTYTYDSCTKQITFIPETTTNNCYWILGDGNTSIESSPVYSYKNPGVYEVSLITNNGTVCSEISKNEINISETIEKHLYIPNTFTPNLDGKNELFEIIGIENCLSYKLEVFDRWGELIYQTDNLNLFWDGTYKEKKVASGIYNYMLSINGNKINGIVLVLY